MRKAARDSSCLVTGLRVFLCCAMMMVLGVMMFGSEEALAETEAGVPAEGALQWKLGLDSHYGNRETEVVRSIPLTQAQATDWERGKPSRGWMRHTVQLSADWRAADRSMDGSVQLEDTISREKERVFLKRAYVGFARPLGRVELGMNEGVEEKLGINAAWVAVASGGIHGRYSDYLDWRSSTMGDVGRSGARGRYWLGAGLHPDNVGSKKRENKVTWMSPWWQGLQLGVSYTPQYRSRWHGGSDTCGKVSGSYGHVDTAPAYRMEWDHAVGWGARYVYEIKKDRELSVSVVGLQARASPLYERGVRVRYRPMSAISYGVQWKWDDWSAAASYAEAGHSLERRPDAVVPVPSSIGGLADKPSRWWSLGAAYRWNEWKFSVTELSGRRMGNASRVHSAGVEYRASKVCTLYGEYTVHDLRVPSHPRFGALRYRGSLALVGVKLSLTGG
jgi:predicted porin